VVTICSSSSMFGLTKVTSMKCSSGSRSRLIPRWVGGRRHRACHAYDAARRPRARWLRRMYGPERSQTGERMADGSNVELTTTQKGDSSGSAHAVSMAFFSPRAAPVSKVLAAPAMSTSIVSMASPRWTRRTTRIARASLACWKSICYS
jgi:hypothetical protein